ncbi:MAG: hypothetical protein IB618_01540 [Candidatus Pacearchaeota archaeon]|nr:MAG: hypothetical protein IB618_01540 [Candidatus Pacearchaeota archaeon]
MEIKEIIPDYTIIAQIYEDNSITELWEEFRKYRKEIALKLKIGEDISEPMKRTTVLSDLIRKKSSFDKLKLLDKIYNEITSKYVKGKNFDDDIHEMRFLGEEYIAKENP